MTAAVVTTPEPGRLYRYDTLTALGVRLIFVTSVEVHPACWIVQGYGVTSSYVLTEETITAHGHIGDPYGVHHEAFCAPLGIGEEAGREQSPLFSDRFAASDASRVSAVERQGRAQHIA